jgi:hypothetical protein
LPENSQSLIDAMALLKLSVAATPVGASGEVAGMRDDDPMCMLIVVAVSAQAAKNGSQKPEWIDGSPRWGGISLKHTAWTPRAALRRTSSAARSASHSGTMMSGMSRPGWSPHHSSTIQSL